MKSVVLATSGMLLRGFEMREVNKLECVDCEAIAVEREDGGILIRGTQGCLYKVLYEITANFLNVTIN